MGNACTPSRRSTNWTLPGIGDAPHAPSGKASSAVFQVQYHLNRPFRLGHRQGAPSGLDFAPAPANPPGWFCFRPTL